MPGDNHNASSETEDVPRRGRAACAECKARKKRCVHRFDDSDTSAPVPVPVSPSNRTRMRTRTRTPTTRKRQRRGRAAKKAGPVLKRAKRGHPAKAAIRAGPRTVPERSRDPIEAASAMSVHAVFSHELEERLEEFEAKILASQEAFRATMIAGTAVQHAVDKWVETWKTGQ
ncbi:hypothetical protein NUU61_006794 [Penicillium alfredii]|uniref:Uncharacterized protein n=1 Tax=Penicillium alfredii TaxID=1506179 RepID=A0A9W9F1L5_9EURO|nr:uncharacterized protein NUU61_006794 [Penicillium alfredii]KAJ5091924.1 hypothetical protein NUU61_006794 [Penicillium alfredii]